jgi:hypothetical protein
MTKKYEAWDLHPRVAYWLNQEGLLYLHEYHVYSGNIDFLTIHPPSGHVSIVECKMKIDELTWPVGQINDYHRAFGIKNASKILFSYYSVLDRHRTKLEDDGFELYITGDDAPYIPVSKRPQTIGPFSEAFEYHYGMTLHDLYYRLHPTSGQPSPFAPRAKTIEPSLENTGRFSPPAKSPFGESHMRMSRFASRKDR